MPLSTENSKIIREKVAEIGDYLKDKLPQTSAHLKRNSYAHLYERIIFHYGHSYKDCEDSEVKEIIAMLEWYKNNPC